MRILTAMVLMMTGAYDILGRRDGDRHYRTTVVMEREAGAWKIAAIRNMQPVQ